MMPIAMHKIGVVFLFQWYAMFIYWQFLAVSLGETVFHATPEQAGPAWEDAIAWSGLMNAAYNFVTMVSALFLVGFAQRIGAKRVHAAALGLAALALIWLSHIDNQYLALVPMIGLGIFWASAVGVPYLMVASMVPAKRTGVYMGILNMMIVVPMLIETVTFGWIFSHLLDNKGSNAIMLAGVLMAIGGVAMLWVNPPDEADESPIMPLGSKRSITVYDRVVVGSDGTPTSLYAVDRAAEVAQAAQARLVVVTAYRDRDPSTASSPVEGAHRDIYGAETARAALEKSVTGLTKERARYIEQRLVPGDPARALLDTVGSNPANLIVVGNRGLGATEGQLVGSVPRDVVKDAVCDVLVVQTSALDEERMFAKEPAEAAAARRSGHRNNPRRSTNSVTLRDQVAGSRGGLDLGEPGGGASLSRRGFAASCGVTGRGAGVPGGTGSDRAGQRRQRQWRRQRPRGNAVAQYICYVARERWRASVVTTQLASASRTPSPQPRSRQTVAHSSVCPGRARWRPAERFTPTGSQRPWTTPAEGAILGSLPHCVMRTTWMSLLEMRSPPWLV